MAEAEVLKPTERAFRENSLSKWMTAIKTDLPDPQIGAENQPVTEQKTETLPDPKTPPAQPQEQKPPPSKQPPTTTTTEAPPEDHWPRSAKEWKNYTTTHRAKEAEFQKQIAERDARIREFEAKAAPAISPEVQKQIDTLQKENEDFSKQLRLVSVTNHPRFKNYFDSKVTSTLAQLKGCVAADQLEMVTSLVKQPDSEAKNEAIDAVLENMSKLQQGRFLGVINALAGIDVERQGEIARAQQDYEQMMAQAKTEREQKQAGFTKVLDETIKTMQDPKNGRPEYQLREGESDWNASVQKRLEAGRKLITGQLAPEVMFKAAFDAAAYADVLTGYRAVLGENEKLRKQIADMTARNPKIEGTKRTETPANETPKLPKDARPMDFTKQWIQKWDQTQRGETGA